MNGRQQLGVKVVILYHPCRFVHPFPVTGGFFFVHAWSQFFWLCMGPGNR